tara:strand:+ start:428 stop:565 length:138 start_codon:yes stop_codon:yes gene_type:complete
MTSKNYEYKIVEGNPTIALLNKEGQDGWIVIDRSYGNILMMREVE